MVKRIEKLTGEQRAMMKPWADKWIKIGLSCEPANFELAEKGIRECYRLAGLDQPKIVIPVSSPLALRIAGPIAEYGVFLAKKQLNVRSSAVSAVRSAVDSEVGSAVRSAVRSAVSWSVDSAVDLEVGSAVRSTVRSAVRSAVDSEVDSAVSSAVRSAVDWAVDSAVDSAVGSAVNLAVRSAVRSSVSSDVGHDKSDNFKLLLNNLKKPAYYSTGNLYLWLCSYESFFTEVCGIKLNDDITEKANAYRIACKNAGWSLLYEDFAIVCDRPEFIKMEDGRLHSADGYAIKWRDGYGLAFWRGTRIPDEWMLGQKPTAAELLKWENIEQRRAGFEIIGWSSLLSELDAKVIDQHSNPEIGTLLEANIPDSGKERFLKATCGTGREFVIPVSKNVKTAVEAQAWTYEFDNYKDFIIPEVRT